METKNIKKRQKKRGVFLKNAKQKEGMEKFDPTKGNGLKLQWLNFISEFIKNEGNGTDAYMKAYPDATRESARRNASRLLTHADIMEEISHRYSQSCVTDAWVISNAKEYVEKGKNDHRMANAAVKALELLARSKGMLTDNKRVEFTGENPAIFMPVCTPAEASKMNELIGNNRIVE